MLLAILQADTSIYSLSANSKVVGGFQKNVIVFIIGMASMNIRT